MSSTGRQALTYQTLSARVCVWLQVMAYPVVGVLWGMARFKEFKQGSKASLALIAAQVAAYSTAVALLASSAELRTGGGHH
jgi:hypothetical protein